MNRRLLALDTAEDIPLSDDLIVVGRHPSCDFRIRSSRVSRIHCCIHVTGDRIFVRDLNSTNGIRINGRSVERAELQPGDVVSIGQIHFKCVENSEMSTDPHHKGRTASEATQGARIEMPSADPIPIHMPGEMAGSSVDIRIRTGS